VNHVWSAAELQEESGSMNKQHAKMHPASEWRVISGRVMMIRTCLSLLIPTVVKDLVSRQVLRRAV
jgi:hypothetical protein